MRPSTVYLPLLASAAVMALPQVSHLSGQGLEALREFTFFGAREPSSFLTRPYSRLLMMVGWASSTRTGGGFDKGGDRWGRPACCLTCIPFLCNRVPPLGNGTTIVVGDGPGSSEADSRIRPQIYIVAAAIDCDSLDTGFTA